MITPATQLGATGTKSLLRQLLAPIDMKYIFPQSLGTPSLSAQHIPTEKIIPGGGLSLQQPSG